MNDRQIIISVLILCFVGMPSLSVLAEDALLVKSNPLVPVDEQIIVPLNVITCSGTIVSNNNFYYKYFRDDTYGLVVCDLHYNHNSHNLSIFYETWQYGVWVKIALGGTYVFDQAVYFEGHNGGGDSWYFTHSGDPSYSAGTLTQTWTFNWYGNVFYYVATFITGSGYFSFKSYNKWTIYGAYTVDNLCTWWKINYNVDGATNYAYAGSTPSQQNTETTGDPADWVNYRFYDSSKSYYVNANKNDFTWEYTGTKPGTRWGIFLDTLESYGPSRENHDANDNDENTNGADLWGSWVVKNKSMVSGDDYSVTMKDIPSW